MRPTRFGQGTHPPSFKQTGQAVKKRAMMTDDGQTTTTKAHTRANEMVQGPWAHVWVLE